MESEAQILLDDAIAFCQRDGQSDRLVNMLSQSTPVELDDESLYVEAPSRFAVAFLEKNRSVVEKRPAGLRWRFSKRTARLSKPTWKR